MEVTKAGYLHPKQKVQIDHPDTNKSLQGIDTLTLRQRPAAVGCLGPLFLINWLNPSGGLADTWLMDRHRQDVFRLNMVLSSQIP